MLNRIKQALQMARANVWLVLAAAFPFADQLLALLESNLPMLAPILGAAAFKWLGAAIVYAKLALQVYRGWQQLSAMLARKVDEA